MAACLPHGQRLAASGCVKLVSSTQISCTERRETPQAPQAPHAAGRRTWQRHGSPAMYATAQHRARRDGATAPRRATADRAVRSSLHAAAHRSWPTGTGDRRQGPRPAEANRRPRCLAAVCGGAPCDPCLLALEAAVHVRSLSLCPLPLLPPSHPPSPSIFKRHSLPSSCPLSTGLRSCICPLHSLYTRSL
jgi:hypothetical protein